MELKLCPTCKTWVFADMETCYGCMYRFGSDPEREEAARREYEGSDFPEHGVDAKGEGASEGTMAMPWPPPVESHRDGAGVPGSVMGLEKPCSGNESAAASEGSSAVFRLPAMTVAVAADGPLPAGVSLSLNLEPPLGGAARCVQEVGTEPGGAGVQRAGAAMQ